MTTIPLVVYAACRKCRPSGPLTVLRDYGFHPEIGDGGGHLLRVKDILGVEYTVMSQDVSATPPTLPGGVA